MSGPRPRWRFKFRFITTTFRFRFHLTTLVAVTLVASVLLLVNLMHHQYEGERNPKGIGSGPFLFESRGWPFPIMVPIDSVPEKSIAEFRIWNLSGDILVALAILAATAFICETAIRRRARADE